ncbi:mandelate racemase/muconate lactonizing enzyme family protein [Aureimonas fodinaquatilis]|uniref:Mandelate racemase/muconate lactonizing enzyme family protein n=1 Tax=Aureimonas fodinaquatilis TaxID=2565783 RepID=A0A5B0DYW5_9HYPH|nr:mandelate racemase/muconate lactonizing enzyme family protein [Aureimonas fodinaquatilis]KAA0971994.1 mandelate racemase/muconate lactonizing enzyme family protein [Aureimonas fodinaquatilis]
MIITDIKCALLGSHPVVRVVTDDNISGYGQIEFWKPQAKQAVLALREFVIGMDPTHVERVMLRIRNKGAFKPWGSAVSAIEMALWDVAGKAAGLPVHKLLGGKVRDKVRVYNGGLRFPFEGYQPEDYAADVARMMAAPENFSIIKQTLAFHSPMAREVAGFHYGEVTTQPISGLRDTGALTPKGFDHAVACVEAMVEVTGNKVGLALDCGPGWTLADAKKFAKAVEPLNLMWLEDLLTGDQIPYVNAGAYRDLTISTSTPIHTGEQIYLRQNFRELIETRAVNILGPDPCDVGGIAELKRVAEYAEVHGLSFAPHGTANGLLGLAALVQVSATLPQNFIAFEYPLGEPNWWYDIVEGLPEPIVKDGFVAIPERPGMGVDLVPDRALQYLAAEDQGFFD